MGGRLIRGVPIEDWSLLERLRRECLADQAVPLYSTRDVPFAAREVLHLIYRRWAHAHGVLTEFPDECVPR